MTVSYDADFVDAISDSPVEFKPSSTSARCWSDENPFIRSLVRSVAVWRSTKLWPRVRRHRNWQALYDAAHPGCSPASAYPTDKWLSQTNSQRRRVGCTPGSANTGDFVYTFVRLTARPSTAAAITRRIAQVLPRTGLRAMRSFVFWTFRSVKGSILG